MRFYKVISADNKNKRTIDNIFTARARIRMRFYYRSAVEERASDRVVIVLNTIRNNVKYHELTRETHACFLRMRCVSVISLVDEFGKPAGTKESRQSSRARRETRARARARPCLDLYHLAVESNTRVARDCDVNAISLKRDSN